LAHAHGALFYADAIQAVGMFPIDVKQAGVDFVCCGTYKWVLGGFGMAPFFIRRELLDRIRIDRFGALHVENELPGHRFELYKTAKRYDYATLPFAEVYQLGVGLSSTSSMSASIGSSDTPSPWRTAASRACGTGASSVHARGERIVDRHVLLQERSRPGAGGIR